MTIDDALLPAASFLTGPEAIEVLRPAVAASGGNLVSCRISQMQYRPTMDLIVRYRCEIDTQGTAKTATLFAGTTVSGIHAGTLPVEAVDKDGDLLRVGVWRWPFDPVLRDLEELVTPTHAARHLSELIGGSPRLEVVVYRPTERAVLRVTGPNGEIYVKIVPPDVVSGLESRHALLLQAGLPVAQILKVGSGWLAMTALAGTTLRDRLKDPSSALVPAERISDLLVMLSGVSTQSLPPVRSRLVDAPLHASMIASVYPSARSRLDEVVSALGSCVGPKTTSTIHGDLHEAQLIVDDNNVTGLLDIDDVGSGDPLDDVGTFLAHMEYRCLTLESRRVRDYSDMAFSILGADQDPRDLKCRIAAALIGLATGPFHLQHPNWREVTSKVLGSAEGFLDLLSAS